jgi:hypothetical protein
MTNTEALRILWETLHMEKPDVDYPDSAWDNVCEAMDALAVASGYENGTIDLLNNWGQQND